MFGFIARAASRTALAAVRMQFNEIERHIASGGDAYEIAEIGRELLRPLMFITPTESTFRDTRWLDVGAQLSDALAKQVRFKQTTDETCGFQLASAVLMITSVLHDTPGRDAAIARCLAHLHLRRPESDSAPSTSQQAPAARQQLTIPGVTPAQALHDLTAISGKLDGADADFLFENDNAIMTGTASVEALVRLGEIYLRAFPPRPRTDHFSRRGLNPLIALREVRDNPSKIEVADHAWLDRHEAEILSLAAADETLARLWLIYVRLHPSFGS